MLNRKTTREQHVPTPPPGPKPRPSSLFNEKFAKRFLRSNGGGGGGGGGQGTTTKARTRGVGSSSEGDGTGGRQGQAQEQGRGGGRGGAGHRGNGPRDEPSTSSESHCRSHITSVAVSHMYQVSMDLKGDERLAEEMGGGRREAIENEKAERERQKEHLQEGRALHVLRVLRSRPCASLSGCHSKPLSGAVYERHHFLPACHPRACLEFFFPPVLPRPAIA